MANEVQPGTHDRAALSRCDPRAERAQVLLETSLDIGTQTPIPGRPMAYPVLHVMG